jgi:hypothetical protein
LKLCFPNNGLQNAKNGGSKGKSNKESDIGLVDVHSPRTDKMVELARARTCPAHAGKHCWVPTIADQDAVKYYELTHVTHIQITDAEMQKWVDEMVCLFYCNRMYTHWAKQIDRQSCNHSNSWDPPCTRNLQALLRNTPSEGI